MNLPTLPPEILAALEPATAALHEEIRTALLLGSEVQRIDRLAGAVARNHGQDYVYGFNRAMSDVLGDSLLHEMREDRRRTARLAGNVDYEDVDDDDDDDEGHDADSCEDYSCREDGCHSVDGCCGCCSECEQVHLDYRTDRYTREVGGSYYCLSCDHTCYDDEVWENR